MGRIWLSKWSRSSMKVHCCDCKPFEAAENGPIEPCSSRTGVLLAFQILIRSGEKVDKCMSDRHLRRKVDVFADRQAEHNLWTCNNLPIRSESLLYHPAHHRGFANERSCDVNKVS